MALGLGPALHRQPRRLVEDDDRVVAMQDRPLHHRLVGREQPARRHRRRGRRRIERRDADRLARGQPVAGLGALAVDPDLPGAQQLFEPAMGQRRVMAPEPAIEAKRPILAVNGHGFDGIGHGAVSTARARSFAQ